MKKNVHLLLVFFIIACSNLLIQAASTQNPQLKQAIKQYFNTPEMIVQGALLKRLNEEYDAKLKEEARTNPQPPQPEPTSNPQFNPLKDALASLEKTSARADRAQDSVNETMRKHLSTDKKNGEKIKNMIKQVNDGLEKIEKDNHDSAQKQERRDEEFKEWQISKNEMASIKRQCATFLPLIGGTFIVSFVCIKILDRYLNAPPKKTYQRPLFSYEKDQAK